MPQQKGRSNPPFMNGVPELLVLRHLRDREMYGYEIVAAIDASTDGKIRLAEGVVYPLLHGLARAGALRRKRRKVGGRSRVYYAITKKGRSRLSEKTTEWTRIATVVSAILGSDGHEPRAT